MRTFPSRPTSGSFIDAVLGWWRDLIAPPAQHRLSNENLLLRERMTALSIDARSVERVEPALYADLATLCRGCDEPKLCKLDLAHNPNGVAWEDYCPNAVVLNAMAALRWFRPKPE